MNLAMSSPRFVMVSEYKGALKKTMKLTDFTSKSPRILQRIETHLKDNPLTKGAFSHYRPARLFHERLESLAKTISDATRDRFEKAFNDLNTLLPK